MAVFANWIHIKNKKWRRTEEVSKKKSWPTPRQDKQIKDDGDGSNSSGNVTISSDISKCKPEGFMYYRYYRVFSIKACLCGRERPASRGHILPDWYTTVSHMDTVLIEWGETSVRWFMILFWFVSCGAGSMTSSALLNPFFRPAMPTHFLTDEERRPADCEDKREIQITVQRAGIWYYYDFNIYYLDMFFITHRNYFE